MNDLGENGKDSPVLIVGAGPTGLTLACDLARRGIRARVIDKSPEPFAGSRGKGVQPRTLEVFDDLGVIDAVLAAGCQLPRMRVHVGPFSFGWNLQKRNAATEAVPYANPMLVPQARTEAILRARLAEFGGRVELASELTHIEQDDHGVIATVACRGHNERVRVQYLVGADGGRSFVRKTLGIGFAGVREDLAEALVGDVYVDGLDRRYWHAWPFAKWGVVTLCPLPNSEQFQLLAQVPLADDAELNVSRVRDLVSKAIKEDLAIRDATWLSRYRPNVRLAEHYRVGRVFLAGDAAHVHPPTGGQGMNACIQDAYNLGWKLGAVIAGAPDALLDTYEEERRPVAAEILGMSTKLYRRRMMRRRPDTTQLCTNYRASSISLESRAVAGGPRAGDRAPDALGADLSGNPQRVFDVLRGPCVTLLVFGARAETVVKGLRADDGLKIVVVSAVARASSAPILVDSNSQVRRTYGIEGDGLVLVRPDGYIGFAATMDATKRDEQLLRDLQRYVDRVTRGLSVHVDERTVPRRSGMAQTWGTR